MEGRCLKPPFIFGAVLVIIFKELVAIFEILFTTLLLHRNGLLQYSARTGYENCRFVLTMEKVIFGKVRSAIFYTALHDFQVSLCSKTSLSFWYRRAESLRHAQNEPKVNLMG